MVIRSKRNQTYSSRIAFVNLHEASCEVFDTLCRNARRVSPRNSRLLRVPYELPAVRVDFTNITHMSQQVTVPTPGPCVTQGSQPLMLPATRQGGHARAVRGVGGEAVI